MDFLTLSVTAADIEAGRPRCATCCPIALAACRALGIPPDWVLVGAAGGGLLSIRRRGTGQYERDRYWLPAPARAFIRAFDNGTRVEPITFTAPRKRGS